MAILFSCPYCTASIKVPDSVAGKLGKCPKCETKIRIPAVAIPPAGDALFAPTAAVEPTPGFPLLTGTFPSAGPLPLPQLPPDPFDFSAVSSPVKTAASPPPPPKPASRNPNTSSVLLIGLIVAILALAGIGGWIYLKSLPVYSGGVAGVRVPSTGKAIAVQVPWSTINVNIQSQAPVIEYFKRHKSSVLSNLLTIEFGATSQGLEIRFLPTNIAALVSVDPLQIPDLKALITEQEPAWDAERKAVLAQFAKELCDKLAKAQLDSTRIDNLKDYRDVVALNALVRGLGRHSVAVSNNTIYPCVFEDRSGKLYFAVPYGATDLTVIEKRFENQGTVLPSDYRIYAPIDPLPSNTPHFEVEPEAPAEPEAADPESPAEKPKTEGEPAEKPAMEMKPK